MTATENKHNILGKWVIFLEYVELNCKIIIKLLLKLILGKIVNLDTGSYLQ